MVLSYLVVANRTLGGAPLLEAIQDRMSRGPASFWVLAPATPTTRLINDFNALSCAFPVDPEVAPSAADPVAATRATEEAQTRLAAELGRLRALGAVAEGSVGDPDPLRAIENVLATRTIDEILLSILPPGLSKWLTLDLPHRLRRRTHIPVTVITAQDPRDQASRAR